jgi:hypothetical protein
MRDRLRPLGVLAVLGKPFKSELLLHAVRGAMGQHP